MLVARKYLPCLEATDANELLANGSAQAIGMVTDVGTFVPRLAETLLDEP